MKLHKTILMTLIFAFAAVPGMAAEHVDPSGLWLASKKKDVAIEITPCDEGLCGLVVWVADEEDKPKLCEKKVLWGFEQNKKAENLWSGGTIYKANDDTYYSADLNFEDENTLNLRGFIGLRAFGKSYKFERVSKNAYSNCLNAEHAELLQD